MADIQQGVRHQSARDAAGTTDTYDGDLRALFNAVATVPAGSTFNEAFMLWLQSVTGSSADNINDLAALYASQQDDTYNWSSVGSLGLPTLFTWEPETAATLPATATFTRASAKLILTATASATPDWYQEAVSGEVPLDGMHRAENRISSAVMSSWSTSGTAAFVATRSGVGLNGEDAYEFSMAAGSDQIQAPASQFSSVDRVKASSYYFRIVSGPNTDLRMRTANVNSSNFTIDSTFRRYGQVVTSTGTVTAIRNNSSGGTIVFQVYAPMVEYLRDASDINNSFVDPTTEFLNIGVNGVLYSGNANGNTVGAGFLITEATGLSITGGGYLPEPSATNLALHSRDFTDAVWVASNITPVQDATGIDGTNQASTLTSTSANGTILQTVTSGSSAHTFAVFVARKTGTGTIEMTIDGGTTWVDITSSLSSDILDRFTVTQTLANPSIGFRIVTSGDEIEIDVAQLVATAFSTSPIITSGSTVTRVADVLSDSTVMPLPYSMFADVTFPTVALSASPATIMGFSGSPSFRVSTAGSSVAQVQTFNGISVTATKSSGNYAGSRAKVAVSYEVNNGIISVTGAPSVTDSTGTPSDGDTPRIGNRSANDRQWRGLIHNIIIYDVAQTQAQLEALVA